MLHRVTRITVDICSTELGIYINAKKVLHCSLVDKIRPPQQPTKGSAKLSPRRLIVALFKSPTTPLHMLTPLQGPKREPNGPIAKTVTLAIR
jgi:hypothetical protein